MKPRKRIKNKSSRQRLIERVGALHLKILRIKHGNKCQLCGRTETLGRFHILSVGSYPRLRFHEQNVLLTCWTNCHEIWHHQGPDDPQALRVLEGVKRLRGEDYRDQLLVAYRMTPELKMSRIELYKEVFKQELKQLEGA